MTPRDIGHIFLVLTVGEGCDATCVAQVEAGTAAEHPAVHRRSSA